MAPGKSRSNSEIVKALIAAGANVNVPEADGTSALLWATYQSSPDLVQLLIKAGADVNAANSFGVTFKCIAGQKTCNATGARMFSDSATSIRKAACSWARARMRSASWRELRSTSRPPRRRAITMAMPPATKAINAFNGNDF